MDLPIVFISSTCEDLKLHRQAARDAALRCDFHPRMMDYFAASGKRPLAECMAKVDESNVLVVIVAPCLFFMCLSLWSSLQARRQPTAALQAVTPAAMAAVEALDETDQVDL